MRFKRTSVLGELQLAANRFGDVVTKLCKETFDGECMADVGKALGHAFVVGSRRLE